MDQNQILDSLRIVTYVTAAKQDATPEQNQRLREERVEYTEAYRDGGSAQDLIDWINSIMGPEWEPSGKYKEFLDKLDK